MTGKLVATTALALLWWPCYIFASSLNGHADWKSPGLAEAVGLPLILAFTYWRLRRERKDTQP